MPENMLSLRLFNKTRGITNALRPLSRKLLHHGPNLIRVALGLYAIAFTYLCTCQLTHERRLREVEGLLTIALLHAESGERAYLLTGNRIFLEQYEAGLNALRFYAPLYQETVVASESKRLSLEISTLLELKKAEMASTITAHHQNRDAAAAATVAMGHEYAEQIYSDLARIRTIEAEQVAPFQIWDTPKEIGIHGADRLMSSSALLLRMQAPR